MKKRITYLLITYFSKSASREEIVELTELLKDEDNSFIFKSLVRTNYVIDRHMLDFDTEAEKKKILEKIHFNEQSSKRVKRLNFFKYAAVVFILFGLGFFSYNYNTSFVETKQQKVNVVVDANKSHDVLPGSNKAVLTLENGDQLVLGKEKKVALKGVKQEGEKLVYDQLSSKSTIAYNYLTIPKGGQFFVQLSDGSKVWLNSDSKLKYPVKFTKDRPREVELIYGEGYFEVAENSEDFGAHFLVKTKTQTVDVLGTQFNIKAYKEDKNIVTTLVEGKIAIESGGVRKNLRPLDQSTVTADKSGSLTVEKLKYVFDEIAWKQGYFSFKQKSMEDIMVVLSRWYNVEFTFKDVTKRNKTFTGVLDRENTISQILINIKKTNEINFKINEKNVIIE
ncbi:FecR family protein [Maribacter ulvicola]|uniref:FecR family protein n=1 Tax=Maribacter ulvicola TaxID=228959 RepID=A0A1N7AN03_9FLAO|nr:FecR family protein [Maribacter ulvicola]SIR40361.1 FecR family protein [Maribacter ulvicola]